ncbi:hypothetical protein ZC03_050 [Pseudomonas phage ZC03]|uniref:Uncharacterized protein n=1 Tax=Pseudomonas phage ZC03 TaxID=1622115 RepID=A0A1L2C945_9CAUD|nr:hypothetical protein HWA93_gp79 [Pseudomonas phage ZC03]AMD43427.1 hypothetical protein ZC03_050 [Pseudomonas phage ZC03]
MKINFNEKNKMVTFYSIEVGQCFMHEGWLYIKIAENTKSVSTRGCKLCTGVIREFLQDTWVEPVVAEVTVIP